MTVPLFTNWLTGQPMDLGTALSGTTPISLALQQATGATQPTNSVLYLVGDTANAPALAVFDQYSTDANGVNVTLRKARGTTGSPSQVQASDFLGGFFSQGYTNAPGFGGNTARIGFQAAEAFTNTAQGTGIIFSTTTAGTTSRTDVMEIFASGGVAIPPSLGDPGAGGLSVGGVFLDSGTLTGTLATFAATQNTPQTSDTGDKTVSIGWSVSASSATSELIGRVLSVGLTNNLTGGGALSNARALDIAFATNASTTTTEFDAIFIENGTASGTVTTGYGVHIASMQGTTKWGVADDSGSNWYNQTGGLALGTKTAAGNGNLIVGGTLQINQVPTAITGASDISIGASGTMNKRISINMNGTTYWFPASTTAF